MCVICVLPKGVVLPYNKLENAVFNNPHGYGIVLKDNNRLEVKKKYYPEGTDPEEIAKILEDNKDIERILHVRWKTEGGLGLDNTQPFSVYYSEGKKLIHREFMHNGTLYEYKSHSSYGQERMGYGYAQIPDPDAPSDSRNFAEKVLRPLFLNYSGPESKADISDPFFQKVVEKFWGSGTNRGIIIANDQDNFIINRSAWSVIKTETGDVLASNDSYFDKLERGYEFEKREKAKREAERIAREAAQSTGTNVVPFGRQAASRSSHDWPMSKLSDVSFTKRKEITKDITDFFNDMDLYNEDEGYASLAALTADEIEDLCYTDPKQMAAFVLMLTSTLENYYKSAKSAIQAKDKATKLVATLKQQLAEKEAANDVPVRMAAGGKEVKVG